jgi:hypothetical protein
VPGEIRGTMSIAMTLAPLSLAMPRSASFWPGQKNEISTCPSRSFLASASVGGRTLATTSAAFHSAAAVLTTSTPAAL